MLSNYFINYAKQTTSALLGSNSCIGNNDFQNGLMDFKYLTFQINSLQDILTVCDLRKSIVENKTKGSIKKLERPEEIFSLLKIVMLSAGEEVQQKNIKASIDALTDICNILVGLNSDLQSPLDPYLQMLQIFNNVYPNLSDSQINLLNFMPQFIANDINSIASRDEMTTYWSSIVVMYQKIQQNFYEASVIYEEQVFKIQMEGDVFRMAESLSISIYEQFVDFFSLSQTAVEEDLTPESNEYFYQLLSLCQSMVKDMIDLSQVYADLSTDSKKLIDDFIGPIMSTVLATTVYKCNLGEYLASVWAYEALGSMVSRDPNVDPEFLLERLREMEGLLSPLGFASPVIQELKVIQQNIAYVANYEFWGGNFFSEVLPFSLNVDFLLDNLTVINNLSSNLASDVYNLNLVRENFTQSVQAYVKDLNDQMVAVQNEIKKLSIENQPYYPIMVASLTQNILILPIQSAFASVMLNNYLPKQDFYLGELTKDLYFSNYGAKIVNLIMEETVGFRNASISYGLGIYLNQMNLAGLEDATKKAENLLLDEKEQVERDINQVNKLMKLVDGIVNSVNADVNLLEINKEELLTLLQKYKINFQASLNQLESLHVLLSSLSIEELTPEGDSYQAFEVKGPELWSYQLAELEKLVISGGKGNFPGGLESIQSILASDIHSFLDLNQNQQLVLQMELTAVQQEWSIVSSSLNIVNSMFSGITRRIKR